MMAIGFVCTLLLGIIIGFACGLKFKRIRL